MIAVMVGSLLALFKIFCAVIFDPGYSGELSAIRYCRRSRYHASRELLDSGKEEK